MMASQQRHPTEPATLLHCAVFLAAARVFRQQRSVVHIKKCRYLENSGCVGMCTDMCKVGGRAASRGLCMQLLGNVSRCLGSAVPRACCQPSKM